MHTYEKLITVTLDDLDELNHNIHQFNDMNNINFPFPKSMESLHYGQHVRMATVRLLNYC